MRGLRVGASGHKAGTIKPPRFPASPLPPKEFGCQMAASHAIRTIGYSSITMLQSTALEYSHSKDPVVCKAFVMYHRHNTNKSQMMSLVLLFFQNCFITLLLCWKYVLFLSCPTLSFQIIFLFFSLSCPSLQQFILLF